MKSFDKLVVVLVTMQLLYAIRKTKVRYQIKLIDSLNKIQSFFRMKQEKKKYTVFIAGVSIFQTQVKMVKQKKRFYRFVSGVKKIQSFFRMKKD